LTSSAGRTHSRSGVAYPASPSSSASPAVFANAASSKPSERHSSSSAAGGAETSS
jgi:hypothetical protein